MVRLLILLLAITSALPAHAEPLPWLIKPEAGDKEVVKTVEEAPAVTILGSITFELESDDINAQSEELKAALAYLKEKDTHRIQIESYAEASSDRKNQARQLSLKRAIAIREELMKQGIEAERIVVRALGENTEDNKNRSDIIAL